MNGPRLSLELLVQVFVGADRVWQAVFVDDWFCSSLGFAQDQNQSGEKGKSDIRTITGCLSKGGTAHEYQLTADDGSTWEVHSSKVMLSEHVGHEVTIIGVVRNSMAHNMKEDTKDAAADTGLKKNNTEHGHMKITDLKMVSDSCQK